MKKSSLILAALLSLTPSAAFGIESICPGGASPRADIIWCSDAETSCADNSSDTCFTDNGFTTRDDHRGTDIVRVVDGTKAVLGTGYYKLKGIAGGTGTGYATYDLATDLNEIRIRWYQYFHQHLFYYHNHFLGISVGNSGGAHPCSRGSTLEIGGQSSVYNYGSGDCGYITPADTSFDLDLHPNQSIAPIIKNGKWYRFELAIKIDTSCTTNTKNGCNGVYKLWIDDALVISYTNLNWGGVVNGALIRTLDILRNYFHYRNSQNPGEIRYDQIVVGNDADTAIGAAVGETNIGTAVAETYAMTCGFEPFYINSGVSYSPELDFAAAGGSRITTCGAFAETWRGNAGTASSSIYHSGISTDHGSGGGRPYAEQSFKAECTGANCGAGFRAPRLGAPATASEGDGNTNVYRNFALPQWMNYGWIYLPSTSVPNDKIAYAGFFGKGTDWHSNYVAMSENTDKWAIIQKHNDGTPTIVATSSVDITRNAFHLFEFTVWDTQKASLMIDGVQIFDQQPLTNSVSWLFDNSHVGDESGPVIGILDYLGTGTVTAYYDDLSMGSVSFWNCDGWDSTMCPYATTSNVGGIFPWLL